MGKALPSILSVNMIVTSLAKAYSIVRNNINTKAKKCTFIEHLLCAGMYDPCADIIPISQMRNRDSERLGNVL